MVEDHIRFKTEDRQVPQQFQKGVIFALHVSGFSEPLPSKFGLLELLVDRHPMFDHR